MIRKACDKRLSEAARPDAPRRVAGRAWIAACLSSVLLAASLPASTAASGSPVASAQMSTSQKPALQPYSRPRTFQWSMRRRDGRAFEIYVSLPDAAPPPLGYPVIYALDPSTAFATLADAVRTHEPYFGPVVVVAIGYPTDAEIPNRLFDLTPETDRSTLPTYQSWGPTGGADAFFQFVQDDVKPAVAALAPLDLHRQALFGHSLGGLFALHILFTHPDAFSIYVAGSPPIWWGHRQILQEVAGFRERLLNHPTQTALVDHHRRIRVRCRS